MTPTEALDIHANPDGHTGTLWREARAVLESAITSRGSLDTVAPVVGVTVAETVTICGDVGRLDMG